ncbi:hypothetical protein [Microbacterium sp. Marseille-Q6965]|uniref:hypothetical protein n=1 Tax=Microbacterium sp. Marseille-Q6965 TaxID=2965072 RepID=UPI0021B7CD31|nr:hypothetical protein [Microbacterium sp. Marseille-Q6965]
MRRPLSVALTGLGLVAALAATTWIAAEDAREGYFATEPRVAVAPGADGWATIGESSVRLASLSREHVVTDEYGAVWVAPDGYAAWRLVIDVETSAGDAVSCAPRVVDAAGRVFTPVDGDAVDLTGWNAAELDCGVQDDPRLETLFVLPDDAEPARVEIVDPLGWTFSPEFYRFELTDR